MFYFTMKDMKGMKGKNFCTVLLHDLHALHGGLKSLKLSFFTMKDMKSMKGKNFYALAYLVTESSVANGCN